MMSMVKGRMTNMSAIYDNNLSGMEIAFWLILLCTNIDLARLGYLTFTDCPSSCSLLFYYSYCVVDKCAICTYIVPVVR